MVKKHLLSFTCITSLICFIATPALSQEGTRQYEPEKASEQTQIRDKDLEKASTAYIEITQINTELQKSIQKAESQEARQQMQHNANSMMVDAVENAGLTAEQYNTIMQQVNANEETSIRFRKKVQDQIKTSEKPEKQKK